MNLTARLLGFISYKKATTLLLLLKKKGGWADKAWVRYSITIPRQGQWADKFTVKIDNGKYRTINFCYICIPQTFCQMSTLNLFSLCQ